MDKKDIETMNIIVSKQKIKYAYLDSLFGETLQNKRMYVPVNITGLLSELEKFKESLEDVSNFELNAAIAIANLIAHYKHYYITRQVYSVTTIIFVRDSYSYDKYYNIVSIIEEICNYFPDIYFLKKLENGISSKALIAILQHAFELNKSITKMEKIIHVYSPNVLDKLLLVAFPDTNAIKIYKDPRSGIVNVVDKDKFMTETIFKGHVYYEKSLCKIELERLAMILGIYFNTMDVRFKIEKTENKIKFKNKNVSKKIDVLDYFIKNVYVLESEKTITEQFMDYLIQNEIDTTYENYKDDFISYEKRFDYFYQNPSIMKKIIEPLFSLWQKKIKDYKMNRDSEQYTLLVNNELQINWLSSS